jgi:cell division protein FtsA
VIPIGGLNITSDIAQGIRTPLAEAERIKLKYGCASSAMIDPNEEIEVPGVGGRPARIEKRKDLVDIIEARVEEIMQAVAHTLKETGYIDMLASGIVLCGGTTQLDGMPEMVEHMLGLPARRATPIGVGGLADVVKSPAYATAVGLVKYGAERLTAERVRRPIGRPARQSQRRENSFFGWFHHWFREVF